MKIPFVQVVPTDDVLRALWRSSSLQCGLITPSVEGIRMSTGIFCTQPTLYVKPT
jgi:hypothetical protein